VKGEGEARTNKNRAAFIWPEQEYGDAAGGMGPGKYVKFVHLWRWDCYGDETGP